LFYQLNLVRGRLEEKNGESIGRLCHGSLIEFRGFLGRREGCRLDDEDWLGEGSSRKVVEGRLFIWDHLEESLETSETATVLSRERMIKEVPL